MTRKEWEEKKETEEGKEKEVEEKEANQGQEVNRVQRPRLLLAIMSCLFSYFLSSSARQKVLPAPCGGKLWGWEGG